jgi:S-adenosylmethionine synthetase
MDDLASVSNKDWSDKTCEMLGRINKQGPDIARGVHADEDDVYVGRW